MAHYAYKYWLILIFSTISMQVVGQRDSLLELQKMGATDILFHENNTFNQKIVSASKSLKEVRDLPFTIHVITREEIINNGYVTLVDALKMVPGIRISQPGSAFEGETFLMRGFKGNAYTKILIDGINYKPSVVSGMPIGAQLPIQQAERIEIIYGPAAALYGADASAGVINIILKKTDRPIFAQAGLQVTGNAYTSLDLMFGGKLGKGKNTLDFSIYANNTTYQDRKIRHTGDTQLFNPFNEHYNAGLNPQLSPNYISGGVDTVALIAKLPHLSRLLGLNLSYKAMELSINTMYRKDHSSIGLNPSAVSYANSLDYIGERIFNLNFNVKKQYKKWGFRTDLNYLDFEMDKRSSTTYIFNTFAIALTAIEFSNSFSPDGYFDEDLFSTNLNTNLNVYIAGNRYNYASSQSAQLVQTLNFYPWEFFEITAGATFNSYFNSPLTDYSPIPLNEFDFGDIPIDSINNFFNVPFATRNTISYDLSSFIQSYITLGKWNIIAGAQYYYHSNYGKAINPRIAILHKLRPNFSLRGFFGTAFRRPPEFYETTNYLFALNKTIEQVFHKLTPERTRSFEGGFRWEMSKKINADVVFFHTTTENLLFFQTEFEEDEQENILSIDLGYSNSKESTSEIFGIQSSFKFSNIWDRIKLNSDLHVQVAKIKENAILISEGFQGNVNEQPRLMLQSRTSFVPTPKFTFTFDGIYMHKFRNKGIGDRSLISRSYFTLDILVHFQLSRTFKMFLKMNNAFNKEYAGIDATGTIDDLEYNPQQKRFFRLGMNYLLD